MLLDKVYEIRVNSRNVKHYENLGYEIPKRLGKDKKKMVYATGEYFLVNINDIQKQSNIQVDVTCDYCGKTYPMQLDNRYKYYNNGVIQKDACEECAYLKVKESNLLIYGVDNISKLEEVKDKMYKTNIERYGVRLPLQNSGIHRRTSDTNLKRYGVDNVLKSPEIRKQIRETNLVKYGVENPSSNKDVQNKIKSTNLKRYGFTVATKNEKVKEKLKQTNLKRYGVEWGTQVPQFREKSNKTLYKNGTAPCCWRGVELPCRQVFIRHCVS